MNMIHYQSGVASREIRISGLQTRQIMVDLKIIPLKKM